MEDDNFYVHELHFEANEAPKTKPFLIKTSAKQPQTLKANNIFSLKEFEQLSKNNINF